MFMARSGLNRFPASSKFSECRLMQRPVMQRGRIEVGSVRPDQRIGFRIDTNLIEQVEVPQGAKQFARKNWSKVDCLFGIIVKANRESVIADDFKKANTIDRMNHAQPISRARWARAYALLAADPNQVSIQPDATPPTPPPGVAAFLVTNPRSTRRDQCRRSQFHPGNRHGNEKCGAASPFQQTYE